MHKKFYGFFSAFLLALLTFSCSQQPIFWAIAQEIKLLDPSVKGNVHTIVRCANDLYTANGNIYRKPLATERGWKQISKPAGNAVYLAASDTHLYAMSATGKECQVYAMNVPGGEWQPVPGTSGKADEIVLFDNKLTSAPDSAAYVKVKGTVHLLDHATLGADQTPNGAGADTVAALGSKSAPLFFNTRAVCNGGAGNTYRADGKKVINISNGVEVSTSEEVTCLAFDSTNLRLIAGTKRGLEEIILDSSGDPQSTALLGANAEAAFGESEIFSLACFGIFDNDAIYAGVGKKGSSNHNALWGYYPSRGNWNYE
ncbi:hypothetical protein H0R92_05040 [Treponema sp. OMZ 840]|uniref:hypothetical protein n=1 Tax=Treponema sp. OMZ 840 TaxID=244313 RepID=UPI003D8C1019